MNVAARTTTLNLVREADHSQKTRRQVRIHRMTTVDTDVDIAVDTDVVVSHATTPMIPALRTTQEDHWTVLTTNKNVTRLIRRMKMTAVDTDVDIAVDTDVVVSHATTPMIPALRTTQEDHWIVLMTGVDVEDLPRNSQTTAQQVLGRRLTTAAVDEVVVVVVVKVVVEVVVVVVVVEVVDEVVGLARAAVEDVWDRRMQTRWRIQSRSPGFTQFVQRVRRQPSTSALEPPLSAIPVIEAS